MNNQTLMDEYIPLGDDIYHINEELSHSKCHFSHPGRCARIPYLHILENERKLH